MFGVVILLVNGFFIDYLSRRQNRIICNKCGYKNSKRHKQCLNCGNDIEDIVCPVCKGLNKYNQKYCSECQTKLLERSEIV